jgi:fructan beta-fructosidase
MKLKIGVTALCIIFLLNFQSKAQVMSIQTDEIHRSKIHFTPAKGWMNDPNGMVYNNGVYHLFYQHNPNASVWGPMHWGHAMSKDMISWKHEPIALYPDDNGTIFSGSAVVDVNNTTGFGSNGEQPLVAIFTYHNQEKADKGAIDFQTQGLAYSLDNGKTWEKYKGNPVLKNPGIRDFRDPKVMWHEQTKKWVMTLAVLDRIHFYSSSNLKDWEKESEFGLDAGEHGGVWECPDLFPMQVDGKTIWALLVNLNPGGPNKGSATQYFLGQFDGKIFQPLSKQTKWLDYGPDEYAGVTWSNTGSRRLFIGWMSNWMYANVVPTETWRSACTIPRELKLLKVSNDYRIASIPVNELNNYTIGEFNIQYAKPNTSIPLDVNQGKVSIPFKLTLEMPEANDFSFVVSNEAGEKVIVGFDQRSNQFYIDRTNAGKKYFHQEFAARHVAPRLTQEKKLDLTLIVDVASIELFADQGLTTMTSILFPSHPFDKASFASKASIKQLKYIPLRMME